MITQNLTRSCECEDGSIVPTNTNPLDQHHSLPLVISRPDRVARMLKLWFKLVKLFHCELFRKSKPW
jgi:hypothetical protein